MMSVLKPPTFTNSSPPSAIDKNKSFAGKHSSDLVLDVWGNRIVLNYTQFKSLEKVRRIGSVILGIQKPLPESSVQLLLQLNFIARKPASINATSPNAFEMTDRGALFLTTCNR